MTEKRNINDNLFYSTYIVVQLEGVCIQNNYEEEFIRENLEEYVQKNWADNSFQEFVQTLREQTKLDEELKLVGVIPEGQSDEAMKAVISHILWQMENKKVTENIKNMQSEIIGLGYKSGNLKVKLNDNVDICLKTWNYEDKKICTLSSRSVEEQKVVLANTEKGDLLTNFSDHFVKEIGAISEKDMFTKILGKLDCPVSDVMFITDKFESALAASETGLMVALIVSKDGISQPDQGNITVINSLTDIEFGTSSKKRKVSNENEDMPVCEPSITNETTDVEMIAVDKDSSGIKEKDEPSTHLELHEIIKSEVGEKPEKVKSSESLATNEHIKENGTNGNQCSSSDIETANTVNKIELEKFEFEKNEKAEKLSSEVNTINADITANNKINLEQPKIENGENSNTEPQSKSMDITPTEPDTESSAKNVGNPEIKETFGGEQTSEINMANVDVSTEKSDSNKVIEEKKADNATSTEKNVENPKGKGENSTGDIIEQTKSSEEANVDTCSATSSGVIKEGDKAEKIDSEMNTSNMDVDTADLQSNKPSDETTCSTEPKITDTEKDLKNIDEQLDEKLSSESNMEVDISENNSTPQNPSEDISAETLHQTESDAVNVKKECTEEVCSSTVNVEVNLANSDSDKLSENTVVDVCPTESKTVNTADEVKSFEVDTAAMDVDTDIKSANEAIKVDNLPSTDSDSAEPKNGDELRIEKDYSSSEVKKSDADIEPETKNIQNPSEINTNTEADKENEEKSCIPSTQITEIGVNETEKSDKEPESKHEDAEEKNSKNVSLENSESENKTNEIKPLLEITNDQNIAEPPELAERSEETNKSSFNESRISSNEDVVEKTDLTESLNGTIENEKTQNGIVENGKLEKYVDENNEIINGDLPSSETKPVVENSLTTGSEIKA